MLFYSLNITSPARYLYYFYVVIYQIYYIIETESEWRNAMDKNASKINFEFLDSSRNFIYDARETGKTHTSFQYEIVLFTAIRNGDIQGV